MGTEEAKFVMGWSGKEGRSSLRVFKTREEAGGTRFRYITEWRIALDTGTGDPIILAPSYPRDDNEEAAPVANVSFERERDQMRRILSRPMPTGVPIAPDGLLQGEWYISPLWNEARRALLEYYEMYSKAEEVTV